MHPYDDIPEHLRIPDDRRETARKAEAVRNEEDLRQRMLVLRQEVQHQAEEEAKIADELREREAITEALNETERAWAQIGKVPVVRETYYFALGDEDAPGYLWDLLRSMDGERATIRRDFQGNQLVVNVIKQPEFEVG